jgi:hypothetical protein
MKSRVDPSALAEMFIDTVREAAHELAERIEPRSEERQLDALLTSVRFVIEAINSIASAHLSPADQELFRSNVEILTLEDEREQLSAATNVAQRNDSTFTQGVPQKSNTPGGTLLWEFAKSVCRQPGDLNPAVRTILSLVAAHAFETREDSFQVGAERQEVASEDPSHITVETVGQLETFEKGAGTYLKVVQFQERTDPDGLVVLYLRPSGLFLFVGYWKGYERSMAAGRWSNNGADIVLEGYGNVSSDDIRFTHDEPFQRVFTVEHAKDPLNLGAATALDGWGLLGLTGPFMYVGQRTIIDPDGEWMPGSFASIDEMIEQLLRELWN